MESGCEILIVGAGITGLAAARELSRRGCSGITIIEKEASTGAHASGRNSGVLHAGIYYAAGSNKAAYCVTGGRLMKDFCREKGLTLVESGKVVVPGSPDKDYLLDELKRRADAAGARSAIIDTKELLKLEPHAAPVERALHSPDTAVVDPKEILTALREELESSGVTIKFGAAFSGLKGSRTAATSAGDITFSRFINAAGAYADRVASAFVVGGEYKTLPFKGTYKKLVKERAGLVKGNIYPVPDLGNPFLGVHFTRSAHGDVYIGPTAIPAFGREEYGVLDDLSAESLSILFRDGVLLFTNPDFRRAALTEIKKYSVDVLIKEARGLLPGLTRSDVEDTPKCGIRPQLVDWRTKKLVNDFVLVRDGDSLHVLNAISPAFTCSLAFAAHVADTLLS